MTDPLTRERVETIRKGCDGVTEGPWADAPLPTEDSYGRYTAYSVEAVREGGHFRSVIVDAQNSDIAEINNDDESRWDEQGRKDCAHIASLDPATVRQLCDAFLALEDARAENARLREAADGNWPSKVFHPLPNDEANLMRNYGEGYVDDEFEHARALSVIDDLPLETARQALRKAIVEAKELRAEIEIWKDRYEAERRDHEATIKHADARET